MSTLASDTTEKAIQKRWHWPITDKAQRYINTFFETTRMGDGIFAKVNGNYGVYKVSIYFDNNSLHSTCSCYIGKSGYCHHCEALAHTFLHNSGIFKVIPQYSIADLKQATTPQQVVTYLQGITFNAILEELQKSGLKPKDVAVSIGITSQRITALVKREKQFGAFSELAPIKIACLWLLDHLKIETKQKNSMLNRKKVVK